MPPFTVTLPPSLSHRLCRVRLDTLHRLRALSNPASPSLATMATQWGNYSDYSGTAKAAGSAIHVRDPRLDLARDLVPDLFSAKNCLDIGCNAGGVSCQLAFLHRAADVTGVDIDPKLVGQAKKLLALRASRTRPPTKGSDRVVDWFPMSAVLRYGYIEPEYKTLSGSTPPAAASLWPRVNFFSADWVTDQEITGPYDVILALSVIKWIHLEHLDSGLKSFFRKCASSLSNGGYLVIELQTWDSYEKAVRPNKAPHFGSNFAQLQYRPETSFDSLLAEEQLHLCASSNALRRPIKIYRKKCSKIYSGTA
ncbi:Bicoid-interacting protein 3-domain-containing protein [Ampelomyces quisqualis]|uniref:RNA methyltransferase n=1 Tax=Ampelomyces quisqualis TaxID=50730 RepID=A0A6A5QUC6_AMPQU|nr:Bicoid-interacting protein 3-domain-containing protein [Ampelomyces quisqualis]